MAYDFNRPLIDRSALPLYVAVDSDVASDYGSKVRAVEMSNAEYDVRHKKNAATSRMKPPPSHHRIFPGYLVVRKLGTTDRTMSLKTCTRPAILHRNFMNPTWNGLPPVDDRTPCYAKNRMTGIVECVYWKSFHWHLMNKRLTPNEFVNGGWEYLCTASEALDATYAEIDRLRALDAPTDVIEAAAADTDAAALRAANQNRQQTA